MQKKKKIFDIEIDEKLLNEPQLTETTLYKSLKKGSLYIIRKSQDLSYLWIRTTVGLLSSIDQKSCLNSCCSSSGAKASWQLLAELELPRAKRNAEGDGEPDCEQDKRNDIECSCK